MTVTVNDTVVQDASSGNRFLEITHLVKKGKNTAIFEIRPTCLVEESGREGYLVFSIGPAKLDVDTVRMTEPSQATIEINPNWAQATRTVKRNFRAW